MMRLSGFAFLAVLLMSTSLTLSARERPDKPAPRTQDFEWMSVATWKQKHEAHVAQATQGGADIVLLGDSITEGWGSTNLWQERFPKLQVVNLGIGGDTTANVLWRLENGALGNLRPRLVVLMIGVNNLGRNNDDPAAVANGIRSIVSWLHSRLPASKILVLGVLPADEKPKTRLRKEIAETNERLAKNLNDRHSIHVENLGAALLEPDGTISPATMADFLHPTPAGYQRLAEVLFPKVEHLLGGR